MDAVYAGNNGTSSFVQDRYDRSAIPQVHIEYKSELLLGLVFLLSYLRYNTTMPHYLSLIGRCKESNKSILY